MNESEDKKDLSSQEETGRLRRALVQQMRASSALHSRALVQAFENTPRERFVPHYFEREPGIPRMVWKRVDAQIIPSHEYLKLIYRDEPLVTCLDARGWPVSSSSQPSTMARMLEALQVQPGMRVLEIGTGTGYHAALLAYLMGDPSKVVTIDRDASLIQQAQEAFRSLGLDAIQAIAGDGYQGVQSHAPYDRIIATASAPTVPAAWVEQLKPTGKLVMDLQGSLGSSGFLVLEKTQRGRARGHFLPDPLFFMPLSTSALPQPPVPADFERWRQQGNTGEVRELIPTDPFPAILDQKGLRWFLQWTIPGSRIFEGTQRNREGAPIHVTQFGEPGSQSLLRFEHRGDAPWSVCVHGQRQALWHELQQAYQWWAERGRPDAQAYQVRVDAQGTVSMLLDGRPLIEL